MQAHRQKCQATEPVKKAAKKTTGRAPRGNRQTIELLIAAIQGSMTPNLLKSQYRLGNATKPLFAHCYHSGESLYHPIRELRLPNLFLGFRPCRSPDDNKIPPR